MNTNDLIKSVLSENIVDSKKIVNNLLKQKLSERLQQKFDEFAPQTFLDEENDEVDVSDEESELNDQRADIAESMTVGSDEYEDGNEEDYSDEDGEENENEEDEDEEEHKGKKKHKKHKKEEDEEDESSEDDGEEGEYGEYGNNECEGGDCFGSGEMNDEDNHAAEMNQKAFHRSNYTMNEKMEWKKSKKNRK